MRQNGVAHRERFYRRIRVWLARRAARGAARLGNGIPNSIRRNRPFKRQGAAVFDSIAPDAAYERTNHPAADQNTSVTGHQVDVDMRAREQPHSTLGQEAGIGQIDYGELTASTKADL